MIERLPASHGRGCRLFRVSRRVWADFATHCRPMDCASHVVSVEGRVLQMLICHCIFASTNKANLKNATRLRLVSSPDSARSHFLFPGCTAFRCLRRSLTVSIQSFGFSAYRAGQSQHKEPTQPQRLPPPKVWGRFRRRCQDRWSTGRERLKTVSSYDMNVKGLSHLKSPRCPSSCRAPDSSP